MRLITTIDKLSDANSSDVHLHDGGAGKPNRDAQQSKHVLRLIMVM